MNAQTSATSSAGVLTLLGLRGVGPQAVDKLAAKFDTLGAVREASDRELDVVTAAARTSLRDSAAWRVAYDRALAILADAERHGVRVLTYADSDYPTWLRDVRDRPPVLYARGTLRSDRRAVACIGTREPSRFGEEVTRRIATTLAERGWSIVSGLAIGVDSLSHRAALDAKGHTVAVLANGLDAVYPKKNQKLAEEILAAGGAWLSEQPLGTPAIPRNLVQRDRLQSGMSAATIVMQTDIVGGSMHTVRFTLMQGRLLVAPVPQGQHAAETKSRGILALTQETGAELRRLLDANGEYADLLGEQFKDRPVAIPLASREDYEPLIARLEEAASDGQLTRPRPQLGLF